MAVDLVVLTVLWVLQLTREIPSLVFWWQIKEYRRDRMIIHLKTPQGRSLIAGLPQKGRYLLVLLGLFASVDVSWSGGSALVNIILALGLFLAAFLTPLALLYYGLLLARGLWRGRGSWTKSPDWTLRAVFLAAALGLLELGAAAGGWGKGESVFTTTLLAGHVLLLPLSFAVVALSDLPSRVWRRGRLEQARRKLDSYPRLLRVGITGSYGKTSSKYFLSQLLSRELQVVSSRGSVNTPIGLAGVVLNQLRPETEVFVAEMGAYKRGEVAGMCRLVKPRVGILTAINAQHQALFGSMAAVERAKYELIESLPPDGLAIFNLDDERVRKLGEKTRGVRKKFYSIKEEADVWAEAIEVKKWRVEFVLRTAKEKLSLEAPFLGRHNVSNLLPGFLVGEYLGLDLKRLAAGVGDLEPPDQTLKPAGRYQGAWLIDDTWNANPEALLAALDYLHQAWPRARKVVVLQPMIELGEFASAEHRRVGRVLAKEADFVFLTNGNYEADLRAGAGEEGGRFELLPPGREGGARLASRLKRGDVVLFEGKEAGKILEKLDGLSL
jgi:UDP-N-acetylmuramoyl-tripeptide--D-alanyl-D-alanine ligase